MIIFSPRSTFFNPSQLVPQSWHSLPLRTIYGISPGMTMTWLDNTPSAFFPFSSHSSHNLAFSEIDANQTIFVVRLETISCRNSLTHRHTDIYKMMKIAPNFDLHWFLIRLFFFFLISFLFLCVYSRPNFQFVCMCSLNFSFIIALKKKTYF